MRTKKSGVHRPLPGARRGGDWTSRFVIARREVWRYPRKHRKDVRP